MILIKQSGPDCLAASAAMVLGCSLEHVWDQVGTKGYEKIFKNGAMRGIHIREIQEVAYCYGKALVPIDVSPVITPYTDDEPFKIWEIEEANSKFIKWKYRYGIAIGYTSSSAPHACAWDGVQLYDPRGMKLDFINPDFTVSTIWVILDI